MASPAKDGDDDHAAASGGAKPNDGAAVEGNKGDGSGSAGIGMNRAADADAVSAPAAAVSAPSQSLHDLLSLGEVEAALRPSSSFPSASSRPDGAAGGDGDNDLPSRLPLLLRWLSVSQPPAAIAPSVPSADGKGRDAEKDTSAENEGPKPPDPNAILPLLEDVAAAHPSAENVEVLVSALAPRICGDAFGSATSPVSRKKTRLTFLQRQSVMEGLSSGVASEGGDCTTWDVASLDRALAGKSNANVTNQTRKRQKEAGTGSGDGAGGEKRQKVEKKADVMLEKMMMVIDILEQDDGEDADGDEDGDAGNAAAGRDEGAKAAPASVFAGASSSSAAANDSHESAVRRLLRELIGLVKASLRTQRDIGSDDAAGEGGADEEGGPSGSKRPINRFQLETGFTTPGLTLESDSPLAEARREGSSGASSSLGGGWSSLSVMIPTLMQHAPILRHEHVASALCRARVPQAPSLIRDMAANCPAATHCLLRGCTNAYKLAEKYELLSSKDASVAHAEEADAHNASSDSSEAKDIIQTSEEAARILTSLSRREAFSAICMLREQHVMDGLVLALLMDHDPIQAASFVVEKLSSRPTSIVPASNLGGRGTLDMKQRKSRGRLTLRQRMVNSQTLGAGEPLSARRDSPPAETAPPRLCTVFAEDEALADKVRRFISERIIEMVNTDKGGIRLGEVSLFIQAYTSLVRCIGIGTESSTGSGLKFVEDTMAAIAQLLESECAGQDLPHQSSTDDIRKMAASAAIVTCCACPTVRDAESSELCVAAAKSCVDCFQQLLIDPASIEGIIFASRVAGFIIDGDATTLRWTILGIFSSDCSSEEISRMKLVCSLLLSKMGREELTRVYKKGLNFDYMVHDPIVAVEALRRSNSQTSNELDDLVKDILTNPQVCSKMCRHPRACGLVCESVKMLVRRPPPHIPLVLPISLDRLAQLSWDGAQFALQVLYALEFLNHQPLSPFVVNPRSLPLDKLLAFLDPRDKKEASGFGALHATLMKLVANHCPDVLPSIHSRVNHKEHIESLVGSKLIVRPTMVSDAIRDCLKGKDQSGLRAEKMFILCHSKCPSLEVDVAAVGAILASSNSQPRYLSYPALCKDPLTLLTARAAVWKCQGLRCILLRVLERLMRSNECIATQGSVTESVVSDYLSSRDGIVVRCLVFACASGFTFGKSEGRDSKRTRHCQLSVSMIRSVISKRRGVIATLIKQDIPDNWIDWIVEYVPESLSDAQIITAMLSEKGLLTATERLTAASAGLKIAIAHYSREEAHAKNLIATSLAVLLDSFTLVVGPIGVPVSVLREEDGQDVTKECRKCLFRMLNALSGISPKSTELKNEACTAISRITALCKSENAVGGVSGAAASRRKALLKEIWDKCLQVNTSLGGSIQV